MTILLIFRYVCLWVAIVVTIWHLSFVAMACTYYAKADASKMKLSVSGGLPILAGLCWAAFFFLGEFV